MAGLIAVHRDCSGGLRQSISFRRRRMSDRADGKSWRSDDGGELYSRTLQAEPWRFRHLDRVPGTEPGFLRVGDVSLARQHKLWSRAGKWAATYRQRRGFEAA